MVNKVSNQKLLFWILILFSILFICIGIVSFLYFKEVKELFLESLNQKVANVNTQKISYESFISNYYTIQSNWLTVWLAFTGILLTIVTIIMPILAMKNNEKQEEHLEKLCDRALESIKKAEDAQKEVDTATTNMETKINTQNQKIEKDMKEVKDFVDKVKESTKQAKISSLNSEALNFAMQKKYKEAIGKYDEILKLDPINKIALNDVCVCLIELQEYKEAIEKLNFLMSYCNDYIPSYYNLIEAYIFNNQIKEAIEILEKYCVMKDSFVYSDDKEKWKNSVKDSISTQEQKDKINKLIDSLKVEIKLI